MHIEQSSAEKLKGRAQHSNTNHSGSLNCCCPPQEKAEGGFISGGKLSYVDLHVFNWISQLTKGLEGTHPLFICSFVRPSVYSFVHSFVPLDPLEVGTHSLHL